MQTMNAKSRARLMSASGVAMVIMVGTTSTLTPAAHGEDTPPATTIEVNLRSDEGDVSAGVFGANHKYDRDGQGMWDTENHEAFPDFVEAFERSGITNTRFPGGTIANTYHWKWAIGPVAERIDNSLGKSGRSSSNEFGPDEWGQLAEQTGTEGGSIVVNFTTGTAQEAADFVEYMNAPLGTNPGGGTAWAEVRAANGHPEPYGVNYWEVGNEFGWGTESWTHVLPEDERAAAYAFGASVDFDRQPAVLPSDRGRDASISDGSADQLFLLKHPAARPGSQTVYIDGAAWTEVNDLAGAGARNVYEFDPATGEITFGDDVDGAIPPDGSEVTVSYISVREGFVDYYEAMKSADPTIDVCTGITAYKKDIGYPVDFLIEELGTEHPYDCVVDHKYGNVDNAPSLKDYHDQMMMLPAERTGRIADLAKFAKKTSGRKIPVIVTEWSIFKKQKIAPYYQAALGGGLFYGSYLNDLIRIGVPLAQKHSLVGRVFEDWPDGGRSYNSIFSAPEFTATSAALIYQLYTPLADSTVVQSKIAGNPTRELADEQALPALNVITAKADDGTVRLIVVNRDRETDVRTGIKIKNLVGGLREATIRELNGPNVLTHSSPDDPDELAITTRSAQVNPQDFEYTFPAHSVTVIELPT